MPTKAKSILSYNPGTNNLSRKVDYLPEKTQVTLQELQAEIANIHYEKKLLFELEPKLILCLTLPV